MFIPFISEKTREGYEKQTDLFSKLLQDRIILVTGEVCQEMALSVTAQLLYLDSISHEPITLYINSEGGEVSSGLSIIDTMHLINSPVHTVCTGLCASMGAMILSSGDKRYSLPNGEVMIHQILSGAYGQATDIAITNNMVQRTKKHLTQMLADNCNQPYEKIYELCERDCWLLPSEAKELGIIDDILKPTKKK